MIIYIIMDTGQLRESKYIQITTLVALQQERASECNFQWINQNPTVHQKHLEICSHELSHSALPHHSTFQLESSVSVVPLGRGKVEEEGLKEKWVMEPRTTAFPFEIKSEP